MAWRPAVILLCLLATSVALAQDGKEPEGGLPLGAVSFNVTAGYSGWALPVANSAVGRSFAQGGGLAWQIGRNMSVVPIRLEIEDRFPSAFRGRVEITSAHGYAREEDPLGHMTLYEQELLVPPSVPTSLYFAPRVCPPSRPGAPVRLVVKIYQAGSHFASQQQSLTVTQLEPSYLYSLYLDGPRGAVYSDAVNAGNRLQLALPYDKPDPSVYESMHYVIATERQMVTGLPLAARDFAFVIADMRQAARWPAAEQAALSEFLIGGGHLCLFNASGTWQGLDLAHGPQEVGRGVLIPVAGGLDDARRELASWLEGELSEFVLLSGGRMEGQSLGGSPASGLLRAGIGFDQHPPYGLRRETADVVSYRPGYMNPVWIYRETCLGGSLEPWDYPEFCLDSQQVEQDNPFILALREGPRGVRLAPLANSVRPLRRLPWASALLMLLMPVAVLISGMRLRARFAVPLGAAVLLGLGTFGWCTTRPAEPRAVREVLIDADLRLPQAIRRELDAGMFAAGEPLVMPVPPGAIVRRVNWAEPGDWRLSTGRQGERWTAQSGTGYMALALEGAEDSPPKWPVAVQVRRLDARRVELTCDTSRLGAGQRCYLLCRGGTLVIPGGEREVRTYLDVPVLPVKPGMDRLLALAGTFTRAGMDAEHGADLAYTEAQAALSDMLGEGWPEVAVDPLYRLGWAGLLRNPLGLRAMMGNQGVLLIPLKTDQSAKEATASFARLTLPLEGMQ